MQLMTSETAPAPAAIELAQLTFGFTRGTDVLHDVTATIPVGATCALVGPNGAGKSTLLECIAGLRRPRRGALRVHGTAVTGARTAHTNEVALVSAQATPPTGFTIAALLRYVAAWHPRWDAGTADALLERFALAGQQHVDTLSFGGRMKVQLIAALAAQPRVLLLDEPFVGLDVATKEALVDGLLSVDETTTRTTLIASHDLTEMELLVDHVLVLAQGHVRLAGDLDVLRAQAGTAMTLRDLYRTRTNPSPAPLERAV